MFFWIIPGANSPSLGKVTEVRRPITEKSKSKMTGIGALHSLQIGATMVTDLAIIPQVPTEVFLFAGGKILSSVNETCVVMMKAIIMPSLRMRISPGINFSSNASLDF